MDGTLKDFGARVRQGRERQRLTQEELAEKVAISRTYLSQIEQGRATNLSLRLAEDLKNALDLETSLPQFNDKVRIDTDLRELAHEEGIPEAQLEVLARVQYRGKRPTTKAQWKLLYGLIKAGLENME